MNFLTPKSQEDKENWPGTTWVYRKEFAKFLEDDEKPLDTLFGRAAVSENAKEKQSTLYLTNKRLVCTGIRFRGLDIQEFPLDKITSSKIGLKYRTHTLIVSLPGDTFTMTCKGGGLQVKMLENFLKSLQKAISDFQSQTPSVEHQSSEGALDKIKKLSELHEAGVLTDEEFESKKAELLDQI